MSPDPNLADGIARAAAHRYGALSTSKESLSCGRALDVAAPREGEDVIDLGCGRGADVARAAVQVGVRGTATGVDGNERMIAAAAASLGSHANARVVQGDLAAVSLPDGCADVVVSNCAINHAPDKGAVYREVHRLLRPGGRFAVSDIVSEEPLPDSVRNDPAAWAACYGGSIPEGDYLGAIEAAGLRGIEVVRRTEPYEKGGVLIRSITVTGRRPPQENR
ncbi:MAG: methyltransferase domain-containing protein [Deltaproteobacteria bacterium]